MASKSNIHCCVPLCTQRERVGPKGEQIGFFKFPDEEEMKKRQIHAIRRDVGRFFRISGASKVCSLHSKLSDISQGLDGRTYLKRSAVPSIFAWKQTSPQKRPPPTERSYQQQRKDRKSVPEKECFSVSSEPEILLGKTPEAVNDIPETVLTKREIPRAPREKHRAKKVPSLPFCSEWPRFVPFVPQKSFLSCVVSFLTFA